MRRSRSQRSISLSGREDRFDTISGNPNRRALGRVIPRVELPLPMAVFRLSAASPIGIKMSLVDPRYSIPGDLLDLVDRSLTEKYTPSLPKTVPPRARSNVSAQIAVEVVELLLDPLRASYEVTDM